MLSRPLAEVDRRPLERLLTQLDLHDVKLAVLERETSRRLSVVAKRGSLSQLGSAIAHSALHAAPSGAASATQRSSPTHG